MTLRQLIIAEMNWVITHLNVVKPILHPATKAKIRTAYNNASPSNPTSFDAEMLSWIRSEDPTYLAYTDTELQAMIDEALGDDDDIDSEILDPGSGGIGP